jgi:D-hexose-6-phosphate mutarotase
MRTLLDHLDERHARPPELTFREGPRGLLFADIDNGHGSASVCLQGAHLTTWRPRAQPVPVVWLSPAAQYAPGKAIRGGIPVCWPWFGPHPAGGALPSHGFARTAGWQVCNWRARENGATELCLSLCESEASRALWPHAFRLELRLTVGAELGVELLTTNAGAAPFAVGEALHAYFQVGDIGAIRVLGLDGVAYVDNAGGAQRHRQARPVRFAGEVDRVYVDSPAETTIVDPVLGRRIRITRSGGRSTVVWNPWAEKAARLGDLGAGTANQGGWREMVCVESGNALENTVTVAPGETHRIAAVYRAESGE